MKIAVLGTGYVGLVAGTCLAESGNDVVCLDLQPARVEALGRGEVPIYEPGLGELVRRNLEDGRLTFSLDPAACADREAIFLAVQTPQGDDGAADLSFVLNAARGACEHASPGTVLVLKSTVPVGTAAQVEAIVAQLRPGEGITVASNPEFLKEGAAIDDFMKPNRVVIGTRSPQARAVLDELYAPFVRTGNPILHMDPESAELTKYASNALLASRISFMNDMARLCDAVGADVELVRRGVGADHRIGPAFLFPGVGYGGSCFPKDTQALIHTAAQHGVELPLLRGAEQTNAQMKTRHLDQARAHFGDLAGRRFAVWGLAFKPGTDDVREAPSLPLIRGLVAAGATVRVADPAALGTGGAALAELGEAVQPVRDNYACVEGADGLFLVTEWPEFRRPDFNKMRELMAAPVIFDGRNIYDPPRMRQLGFTYYGIGRP